VPFSGKILPLTYSPSAWIAVYTIGVVTNITMATHRTLPEPDTQHGELMEVVKMVSEVCLLTNFRGNPLLKVAKYFFVM